MVLETAEKEEGMMERKTGINVLIGIYGIAIFGTILKLVGITESYANRVHLSLLIAVLALLIIGFLKRINAARIMAIIFHIVFQLFIFVSIFDELGGDFLEQAIKHILEPGAIILVILLLAILATSIPNIVVIGYLVKNKEYFSIKKS